MTTFVATALKYVSAGFTLHSLSEPVHFASLSFLGLISLFHFIFSYIGLISRIYYSINNRAFCQSF